MSPSFRCGHPREGNTSFGSCKLCQRVRKTLAQHKIDQDRINAGLPVRPSGPVSRYA